MPSKTCNSILVVEDDKDIRDSLTMVLEMEGYNVVAVTNGQEAIEELECLRHPCLILLDLMMPVMNGWEFLKARDANDVMLTIPVVVVSAVSDSAIRRPKSATEFIKKPVELSLLLQTVKQYCG
ncbi:MAG: response regulator [Bdellovibrionota bacterium]